MLFCKVKVSLIPYDLIIYYIQSAFYNIRSLHLAQNAYLSVLCDFGCKNRMLTYQAFSILWTLPLLLVTYDGIRIHRLLKKFVFNNLKFH
jgi:hypothetical protein